MAVNKNNGLAYDLSLFEPEPVSKPAEEVEAVKVKNRGKVIRLEKEDFERSQRRKRNPVVILSVSMLTIIVAAVFSLIVYNNVMINELSEKIIEANGVIENQENLEAQYQLKIDRKLTDQKVQEYAEQKLGMVQANSAQKQFVSLTDGDKGEVIRGDEKQSFLDNLARVFHL